MKIAANISTLFRELPLPERFEAARLAGFDGVEIQASYAESPEVLSRAAQASGMAVILINGPTAPGVHPPGIACRPELRAVFRAQLPQIREYADALQVRFVHVLAGGISAEDDAARCREVYVDNLLYAAAAVETLAVIPLIEPLNPSDVPDYLLGSFPHAQSVIEECSRRVGLQFDAYHAARMGLDPAAEFTRVACVVKHLQFADAPGRHEPGTGRVPLESFVRTLHECRYDGWLGAEYTPQTTTTSGLQWLPTWRAWNL